MAHFAILDENNIVIQVVVGRDEDENAEDELTAKHGQTYKRTSYNTVSNTHRLGGTPFRGNYASVGGIYDPDNDVFYLPQPYPSWVISADTGWVWKAPVDMPDDGKLYTWNEDNTSWDEVE